MSRASRELFKAADAVEQLLRIALQNRTTKSAAEYQIPLVESAVSILRDGAARQRAKEERGS